MKITKPIKNDLSSNLVVSTETDSPPNLISNSSWFNRTFSKFDGSSLRNSILTLIVCSLGTGIFTFHKLFNEVGIVLSIILIFIYAALYMLTMDFLGHASDASKEAKTLSELVSNLLGPRVCKVYDFLFFLNNFIVLIAFVGSISGNIYANVDPKIWEYLPETEKRDVATFNKFFVVISGCVLFLFNLMKTLASLAKYSIISISVFTLTIIVIVAQTPTFYKPEFKINWVEPTLGGLLKTFGLLIYSYNCLFNFYGMKNALNNPIPRRMRKISMRTFGTLAVLFVIVGLASYFSLGAVAAKTTELFIFRVTDGPTDYWMMMCRFGLAFSLVVSYTYVAFPLRVMTKDLFKIEESLIGNMLSSLFFSFTPIMVSVCESGVNLYVGVSGALTTSIIVFTVPAYLSLKTGYVDQKWKVGMIWAWIVLSVALAIVGTVVIIAAEIEKK